MGGLSKWNILGDTDLSASMPEVFAPPPEVVSGFMADDVERALIEWNPLVAGIIRQRGLFGTAPRVVANRSRSKCPAPKAAASQTAPQMGAAVFPDDFLAPALASEWQVRAS